MLYICTNSQAYSSMKRFLAIILIVLTQVCAFASDSLSVIYRIRLDSDIDKSAQRLVTLGLEKATAADADFVLLDLDTYGGAVDAADSIRSAILRYDRPIAAYVNMQAASAGALISIACDSIYMKTGSSIGAATVVDQSGNVYDNWRLPTASELGIIVKLQGTKSQSADAIDYLLDADYYMSASGLVENPGRSNSGNYNKSVWAIRCIRDAY